MCCINTTGKYHTAIKEVIYTDLHVLSWIGFKNNLSIKEEVA